MAGQLPSKGRKIVIDDFHGIIQVYDETLLRNGIVKQCYGLIDTEQSKLMRIGGKLPLLNCSTSSGSFISMQQLHFASSAYIVTHHPTKRMLRDYDLSEEEKDGIDEYGL